MHGTEAVDNATRDMPPLPRYAYHPREVAEMTGVSERYIWFLIERGDLIAVPLGRGRKVLDTDLRAFLERLRTEAVAAQEHAESGAGQ